MTEEHADLTATRLLTCYRDGTLSPVEVMESVIERIERWNPRVNAFAFTMPEEAMAAARAAETRWRKGAPTGRLDGVPVTVKDLLLMQGHPTRKGSLAIEATGEWLEDAPCVARLKAEGAVIIGKTTTPEFGWKAVTDSPLNGLTRNPWDPERTTGGSSGGAAAAAATGMGALHIGTDGGGSIRIPAAFCGIFGVKPTFGRVPAYPASVFGTLAHIGPMTRSVADARLMLEVISQPDRRDWHALPGALEPIDPADGQALAGARVGYLDTAASIATHPEVKAAFDNGLRRMESLGARVEPITLPFENAEEVFRILWYSGARHLAAGLSERQRSCLEPGFGEIVEQASAITLDDFLQANEERNAIGRQLRELHAGIDFIATPTVPIPPFAVGREVPPGQGMRRWHEWAPFSYPFNLTQQPAATLPCGMTADGLPIGLQLVADRYADSRLLSACEALEAELPSQRPKPAS